MSYDMIHIEKQQYAVDLKINNNPILESKERIDGLTLAGNFSSKGVTSSKSEGEAALDILSTTSSASFEELADDICL